MRYLVTFVSVLLLGAAASAPLAARQSDAVKTVAGMLLTIQHFPNDAQKKTLQDLEAQSGTTANEKVLIEAVLHLEHSVPDADKAKLAAITEDADAPAPVKQLAGILGHFLHMASDADKATLKELSM